MKANTRLTVFLAVIVGLTLGLGSAQAHLIQEMFHTGPVSGNPEWQHEWIAGVLEIPLDELFFLGKFGDDGPTIAEDPYDLLAGEFIQVSGYYSDEDRDALVSWNLMGTGWELAVVFVKNGLWHTLYSVSDDQVLASGDWEKVELDPSINRGAISHISFFGRQGTTSVPDGGMTVLLLGLALTGIFGVSRRIRT